MNNNATTARPEDVPLPDPTPIILDHDGSVDDLMALLLVLSMPEVELRAVVVTEADCYVEPALSATHAILRLAGRPDVPVGVSAARPVNPMPAEWRAAGWIVDSLPILQATRGGPDPEPLDGERLMADALRAADRPVTLLITGPLSCLAAVLRAAPALAAKIERVLWMGGAIRAAGNVSPFAEHSHDGTAEWNAYWDPAAVAEIWACDLDLVICPLDATDQRGLEPRDLSPGLVAQRDHAFSDLAGQAYAIVRHLRDYYMWDVTTAAFLAWPEIYRTERLATRVHVSGASEGRTELHELGREAEVIVAVDPDALRARLLERWARG
jgi:purine nucleosidase